MLVNVAENIECVCLMAFMCDITITSMSDFNNPIILTSSPSHLILQFIRLMHSSYLAALTDSDCVCFVDMLNVCCTVAHHRLNMLDC